MSTGTSTAPSTGWRGHVKTAAAALSLASARSAILATFGLGLCYSVIIATTLLKGSDRHGDNGVIAIGMTLLAALAIALALYLARRKSPLSASWFVAGALLAALAIRIGYYLLVDPAWISDFARYWRVANELANADHYQVSNLYYERALPFLTPLAEVFGSGRDVVKLANIGLLCFIQLAGYDVLRRCHGHNAAQCFTVLWIAAPEPLFSAMIPSHDLIALAQTTTVVWLVTLAITARPRSGRRKTAYLFYAIPIAITLAALEMQRGIGLLMQATLLAVGVAVVLIKRRFPDAIGGGLHEPRRLLLIALLSLPLYALSMWGVARSGLTPPEPAATSARLHYMAAHASSLSNGSYAWMVPFRDTFTIAYDGDNERLSEFRNSLALSDFTEQPLHRVVNLETRLQNLYNLGGSLFFYTAGVGARSAGTLQAMRLYNSAFAAMFAAMALIGLLRLLTGTRVHLIAWILLVAIAAITLVLSMLAENQARYLYIVWLVAAAIAALGIARPQVDGAMLPGVTTAIRWRRGAWLLVEAGVTVSLLVALAFGVLNWIYQPGQGRILANWTLSDHQPASPAPVTGWARELTNPLSDAVKRSDRTRPYPQHFGPLALTLQLPYGPAVGDFIQASKRICSLGSARNDLSFFVYTPYKNLKRTGAFQLEVSVDGQPHWQLALPASKRPIPVEIPNLVPNDRCFALAFTLRSTVNFKTDSWRRASRVEIFFPRLVDALP